MTGADVSMPTSAREPEGLHARRIWLVGLGTVVVSLGAAAISWWLVIAPPAGRSAAAPSSLVDGLFEAAARGSAAGALERTEWIDRDAGMVRIPIDEAIEAVVAEPSLIATPQEAR